VAISAYKWPYVPNQVMIMVEWCHRLTNHYHWQIHLQVSKPIIESILVIWTHSPKGQLYSDLGFHIINDVENLCLTYHEDDRFPQRCGDHKLCIHNTLHFSVDIVDSFIIFYGRSWSWQQQLIIYRVQMPTWILVLTLSMVCIKTYH
jgi:hypothetical protein